MRRRLAGSLTGALLLLAIPPHALPAGATFAGLNSDIAWRHDTGVTDEIYTASSLLMGPGSATSGGDDESPDWSPDGTKIAFARWDGTDGELWVVNADGSGPKRLTNDTKQQWYPAWSPDGTQIAFESDRGGADDNIWTMNANGSGASQTFFFASDEQEPDWSPDGTRMVYVVRGGDSDLVVQVIGGAVEVVTADALDDFNPSWRAGCTIVGTPGADVLPGTAGRDRICGLGGRDRLTGLDGEDAMFGGAGKDVLRGGSGEDVLAGGPAADKLMGGSNNDLLNSRDGKDNDSNKGGPGADQCIRDGGEAC